MKKVMLAIVFALLFATASPLTGSANSEPAKNGLYKLDEPMDFITMKEFKAKDKKGKKAIFTSNYYYIIDGQAIKAIDIILSTSAVLPSKMMTEEALEKMYQVEIDSDGKISPSDGIGEAEEFKVLSID